jgi:hypothetical protein
MLKVLAVVGTCATVTVVLGAVNIWLGILALPITYEVAQSLLGE